MLQKAKRWYREHGFVCDEEEEDAASPHRAFGCLVLDMLREGTSLVSCSTSKGVRKATHATWAYLYLIKNRNNKK